MSELSSDANPRPASEHDAEQVEVYLDDGEEPIASYRPPARIQLDTHDLEDGTHRLRIEADGDDGMIGVRTVEFEVRNGPSIAVDGLADGDVVEGELSVMVHAWGGASSEDWEPSRSESPAPAPTWAWVLLMAIVAWAMYYGVRYWQPTGDYADSPTYPAAEEQKGDE